MYYPVRYVVRMIRKIRELCKYPSQRHIIEQHLIMWQNYVKSVVFNSDGLNRDRREQKIIASLTSYPARINEVPYVIASLLNQTMKPDKIILWLSLEQFPDRSLPDIFSKVLDCGAEVRFCDEDLGPHKKYFYAVQEYPEDLVITFDDDIIYPEDVIETLYRSYLEHPECVSGMVIRRISFAPDGRLRKSGRWEWGVKNCKGIESYQYIISSGAGKLYPPHAMHKEAFNAESIMKYCPKADELWCKIMEVLNHTKAVAASDSGQIPGWGALTAHDEALSIYNEYQDGNDIQMSAMIEAYNDWLGEKTLLEILREDPSV